MLSGLPDRFDRTRVEVVTIRKVHHGVGEVEPNPAPLRIRKCRITCKLVGIPAQDERDIDQTGLMADLFIQFPKAALTVGTEHLTDPPRETLFRLVVIDQRVIDIKEKRLSTVSSRLCHVPPSVMVGVDQTGTRMFLSTPPESDSCMA